jgi:hypothetical protein
MLVVIRITYNNGCFTLQHEQYGDIVYKKSSMNSLAYAKSSRAMGVSISIKAVKRQFEPQYPPGHVHLHTHPVIFIRKTISY